MANYLHEGLRGLRDLSQVIKEKLVKSEVLTQLRLGETELVTGKKYVFLLGDQPVSVTILTLPQSAQNLSDQLSCKIKTINGSEITTFYSLEEFQGMLTTKTLLGFDLEQVSAESFIANGVKFTIGSTLTLLNRQGQVDNTVQLVDYKLDVEQGLRIKIKYKDGKIRVCPNYFFARALTSNRIKFI